jgi:uncharacterized peroxidase-related enzyme
MERIKALNPATASGKTKELFDGIQQKLGRVPNLLRTIGQSPAALAGYLGLNEALGGGNLSAKFREQIALVVAETNNCAYCLSAHTAIGQMVGLSQEELLDSRRAEASDNKSRAGLIFARRLVSARGRVSDGDLAQVRAAGFSDGEIAELIANVVINLYTNYFNHVAGTQVDFPLVTPLSDQQQLSA